MEQNTKENLLVFLTGNSGSGKTTTMRYIANHIEGEASNAFRNEIVSHTTRDMRPGEVEGKDYYFVTKEDTEEMEFVEKIDYLGTIYAVEKENFFNRLSKGHASIIVTGEGKEQIEKFHKNTLSIFLVVEKEALRKRLVARGEKPKIIEKRMNNYEKELVYKDTYDVVINIKENDTVEYVSQMVLEAVQNKLNQKEYDVFVDYTENWDEEHINVFQTTVQASNAEEAYDIAVKNCVNGKYEEIKDCKYYVWDITEDDVVKNKR